MKFFEAGRIVIPPVEEFPWEVDEHDDAHAVIWRKALLGELMEHALRYKHTEILGLLLGRAIMTPSRRTRTVVTDYLLGDRFAASNLTYVQVSAEEVLRLDDIYEASPQKRTLRKLGWFHTHPGHGIFMSGTDRATHRMFSLPWQVALVLDPCRNEHGFFAGEDCLQIRAFVGEAPVRPPAQAEPPADATPHESAPSEMTEKGGPSPVNAREEPIAAPPPGKPAAEPEIQLTAKVDGSPDAIAPMPPAGSAAGGPEVAPAPIETSPGNPVPASVTARAYSQAGGEVPERHTPVINILIGLQILCLLVGGLTYWKVNQLDSQLKTLRAPVAAPAPAASPAPPSAPAGDGHDSTPQQAGEAHDKSTGK